MAPTFREAGWVWEGLGFDPGLEPSVYGVGEGAEFLNLDRVNFMFHRNNHVNLERLRDVAAVVPEISKWKWVEVEPVAEKHGWGFAGWRDSNPETVIAEAADLSRLSLDFANVTGALIDDTSGMFAYAEYNPDRPRQIAAALRSANPDLRLWMVVYTHELQREEWQAFEPYLDVANLWVWECQNLPHLEEYVDQVAARFPGKDIIVGSYLRDYPTRTGVPLDLMETQYETMLRLFEAGKIAGYNILGACLIDMHPAQAEFIREFIAKYS